MTEEGLIVKFIGDDKSLTKASNDAAKALDKVEKSSNETTKSLQKNSLVSGQIARATQSMAKSAGIMGGALDKSSKASGTATQSLINLSRVAQDAPYGFIGIANNLNPLLEGFQRLSVESKAAGVSLGSQLKSALIGPAGIGLALGIASSLVIAFGDEIAKAFSRVDKEAQGFKRFNDIVAGASDGFVKASSLVNELGINIDLAKKGILDKGDVLKQYNATLGKTTGEVKNLDQAEKALTANGEAYVRMMLYKAAANVALTKAAEKAFEAEQTRLKKDKEFAEGTDKLEFTTLTSAPGALPANLIKQTEKIGQNARIAAQQRRKAAAIKEAEDESNTLEGIAKKFQTDAANIASKYKFNFFDELKKESDKSAKPSFNFFDKFFDFQSTGKLTEKQRAGLLDAARSFQKEFGDVIAGMDFFQTTDEASLNAAREFWANFQKGIVTLKPPKIVTEVDIAPVIKQSGDPNTSWIKAMQDSMNKDAAAGFISPDLKKNLLEQYKRLFESIGKELPKQVQISTGQIINVDNLNNIAELSAALAKMYQQAQSQTEKLAQTVSSVLTPAFQNMFSSIIAGEDPLKSFFKSIGQSVTQLISQLIAAAIQAAILSLITGGAAGGGLSFAKAFGKVTGFAAGGLTFGPTLALVGEGAGTSRNNPEIIAPLDKLKQYIGEGFGGGGFIAETVIRGDDLGLVISRNEKKRGRLR